MEIILPCAGLSTRFPDMRPKYLLTDYSGRLMIDHIIRPYLGKHPVSMIVLAEHEDQYRITGMINKIYGPSVNVCVLQNRTKGPAETVHLGLQLLGIGADSPVMIRDCDSFFEHGTLVPGNRIHVSTLDEHPNIRNAAGKSYVISNNQGLVSSIIEKNIVSNTFCVGGYQFARAGDFARAYENLAGIEFEPFISSCIDYLVSTGHAFDTVRSAKWMDVGTAADWLDFNNRPTIFCDIDGTVIENQAQWGENDYQTNPVPLVENINVLLDAANRGCQLIFTTARPQSCEGRTKEVLNGLGFSDYQLIMGLHHARRILINDHAPSNPYPSAVALSIDRNGSTLPTQLRFWVENR